MTAIPATLHTADYAEALEITLDGLTHHSLTEAETRDDILLVFDMELTSEQARQMSGYLSRMLSQVRCGGMAASEAARDIRDSVMALQGLRPLQYELSLS